MDCIFCKIVNGEIPSSKVYEDDLILAFNDIQPVAPVHVVIIPKAHTMNGAADITAENSNVIAHIFEIIPKIAKEMGIAEGFRVVTNNGADAGQSVNHIHFHLIGGKVLEAKIG